MRVQNTNQNTSQNNSAQIEWRDGQPYASAFDDVYFSSDNGLAETEYVFLEGNDLAKRWKSLSAQKMQMEGTHGEHIASCGNLLRQAQDERRRDTPTFTIAETGFGTGLNFLCAAKLWLKTAPENAVLHFISTEKYPLSLQDISKALQLWPTLAELSEALLVQYENLLKDNHLVLFNQRIQLTLLIGDATEQLASITISPSRLEGEGVNPHHFNTVNAWFLDGFAPSKNPEMWQATLFQQVAKLSSTETTIATFTSAGGVRRGLIDAGFTIKKRAGFGKKREMLVGSFVG